MQIGECWARGWGNLDTLEAEDVLPLGQRHTCGGATGWPPRRGALRTRGDARCAGAQAGS